MLYGDRGLALISDDLFYDISKSLNNRALEDISLVLLLTRIRNQQKWNELVHCCVGGMSTVWPKSR